MIAHGILVDDSHGSCFAAHPRWRHKAATTIYVTSLSKIVGPATGDCSSGGTLIAAMTRVKTGMDLHEPFTQSIGEQVRMMLDLRNI